MKNKFFNLEVLSFVREFAHEFALKLTARIGFADQTKHSHSTKGWLYMIGLSLPPGVLLSDRDAHGAAAILDAYGSLEALFSELRRLGVGKIELRSICPDTPPDVALRAAKSAWAHGMDITVHGRMLSLETAAEDVYVPLAPLLEALNGRHLIVTLHPIAEGCVEALTRLSDIAYEKGYNLSFALENCRATTGEPKEEKSEKVLATVTAVDRKNVGICWDMGHFCSDIRRFSGGDMTLLPSPEFLRRTIHTHIHDLNDENNTHLPLNRGIVPVSYYCNALGYTGTYNIELMTGRYKKFCDVPTAISDSVLALRRAIPLRVASIEDYAANYASYWGKVPTLLESKTDAFMLQKAAGYIFNLNGTRFAMDLNLNSASMQKTLEDGYASALSKLDCYILTHEHSDHYDRKLIAKLAKYDIKWIVPDFFDREKLLSTGIPQSNITYVSPGEIYTVKSLKITPFTSFHYRPGTLSGTKEYGYRIVTESGKSLLFPVDVRDYDISKFPRFDKTDFMFSHVWLGDKNALKLPCEPYTGMLAEFICAFSPKKVVLAHLYENGRKPDSMWSFVHAGLVTDALYARNPSIKARAPRVGEICQLE